MKFLSREYIKVCSASPTSSGHSVSIVDLQTKGHGVLCSASVTSATSVVEIYSVHFFYKCNKSICHIRKLSSYEVVRYRSKFC
jgi:hypothetical protein